MTVLQRKELESSPLADLHAIASELGLEGFRSKRKDDLIGSILEAEGAEPAPANDEPEPDEVPSEEALESTPEGELDVVEEEPEVEEEESSDEEILTGPLDILANGSGFLRLDPTGQSRDDVYVSPAPIPRRQPRPGHQVRRARRPT